MFFLPKQSKTIIKLFISLKEMNWTKKSDLWKKITTNVTFSSI